MFGAILSPHRQLQIAHMARRSESMPLSSEAARNNNQPSKRVKDFSCRVNGSKKGLRDEPPASSSSKHLHGIEIQDGDVRQRNK